ncbi:P-loop containing nucleoside triphosphate hydrolase protein [Lentinula edodes]|uniref:P-loop containing nucleoside triphosphate hydrolase protein n=1 Tax=Lentinula lateritia TaxID=40482 RepID=A0A9W9B1K9_9AGAR|nr:P-loop containing nucleoside triphosphate hydrolase protein [Lentinula edodes]
MSFALNALTSASKSQLSLFSNRSALWLLSNPLVARRFKSSGKPSKRARTLHNGNSIGVHRTQKHRPSTFAYKWSRNAVIERPELHLSLDDHIGIVRYFEENVEHWSKQKVLHSRLESFGIPTESIHPLLQLFVSEVLSGNLSNNDSYDKYTLDRFARSTPEDLPQTYADIVYTGIFYAWAADPASQDAVERTIGPATLLSIQRLFHAARLEHPADDFLEARRTRRKIIMHVGPTNSGKTHHALRALAAAPTGVYAGPLRLLAHEIWERLNLGQIVPAGVEQDVMPASLPIDSALDVDVTAADTTPAVLSQGNTKFARACNMITGEEHKIVDPEAALESATVEMLSMTKKYDLAVIDEIQMIADVGRGYAWTSAVLGINAKEVHLCGEETAVPIVQALLAETHDELEVRRYKRLTPLQIDKSLDKDLSKVQKGDCVVAFSRSSIFWLKNSIEKATGMKCAVVYGKLPPEIRSGQADLFNDPNSGYDVIVGSDAIGMGLNLKIRRIVFEAVSKFDGEVLRPLSISQTKQIAGRAGRYGMLQEQCGLATTFLPEDLPFVEQALAKPFAPLPAAILGPSYNSCRDIARALPPSASLRTIYDAHVYVAKTKPHYRYSSSNIDKAADTVDEYSDQLSLEDRITFLLAPVPWREPDCVEVLYKLLKNYAEDLSVGVTDLFQGTQFLETLLIVEKKMSTLPLPKSDTKTLSILELFHKLLGLYAWLAFRNPVAYYEPELVEEWKPRVERALHWALQGVTRHSKGTRKTVESPLPVAAVARKVEFRTAGDLRKQRKAEALSNKKTWANSGPVHA